MGSFAECSCGWFISHTFATWHELFAGMMKSRQFFEPMQNSSCIHFTDNQFAIRSADPRKPSEDKNMGSMVIDAGDRKHRDTQSNSPSQKLCGSLLNSCLFGSPERRSVSVVDMSLPPCETLTCSKNESLSSTSPILLMLNRIKSDISKLKSTNRTMGVIDARETRSISPSRISRLTGGKFKDKSTMDRMNEIELLLLETEESLANMSSRLDSTEMRIRNRTAML